MGGKGVNDPCNPGVILFLLRNEHSETGKKGVIKDVIEQCGICKNNNSNNNKGTKTKQKRKMSWYNACIKVKGKDAMMTGECKKDNLSESDIGKWQKRADEFNG